MYELRCRKVHSLDHSSRILGRGLRILHSWQVQFARRTDYWSCLLRELRRRILQRRRSFFLHSLRRRQVRCLRQRFLHDMRDRHVQRRLRHHLHDVH